jgi:sodium transport system ATP-binding protein
MIEVDKLTKEFKDKKGGRVLAVNEVSFTCNEGEVFGLLGPNGAGKTTTLRMLSTSIKPTSGTAKINGIDLVEHPDTIRKQIGFLSGATGLYGRLTAREMVEYFGKLYGMKKERIDARIQELFTLLDMHEFADARCEKLSTGMKQKVSIVRTVLHDPPVMVFDEPTSGLDVMSSRNIVDFIFRCKQQNKCVIFSTHIMSEARRLCDRVAIIHNGKIYKESTVDQLLESTGENNLEDAFLKIVGEEPARVE